jgi:hypothetical protein
VRFSRKFHDNSHEKGCILVCSSVDEPKGNLHRSPLASESIMSTAENPNVQAIPEPDRQLPPADFLLPPRVAGVADWVGRTQVRTGQVFSKAYRTSLDSSISFLQTVRDRSRRIKQENPTALLAGIAGTAFALGVAVRVWRSRR